jgi:uncharacterized damage-inducible protein DinB
VTESTAQSFLEEFDREMAATRRLLERVPENHLAWKPHAKSRSLGELATHVTELPRWGSRFEADRWQLGTEKAPSLTTAQQFLARFDENVAAARMGIATRTDAQMQDEFTVLRPNGDLFMKLRRTAVVRQFLLNHLIHHRGQLTVYFREKDVPLPSIYGPTADQAI